MKEGFMTAPVGVVTQIETFVERLIDYLQTELNDPVFMADLEKFLTLVGDFLEMAIGEQVGTVPPVQAKPAPVSQSAAQPVPSVNPNVVRHTPGDTAPRGVQRAIQKIAGQVANQTVHSGNE